MSQQLGQRIYGELEQIVLIDPHTHINPHAAASTTLADIMGYHYYTELAHAAGLPLLGATYPAFLTEQRVRIAPGPSRQRVWKRPRGTPARPGELA